MTKFVAFLRALNVGGTSVIKMEALRRLFESFGLRSVQTYIQSGNVIFEARSSPQLEARLEKQLQSAALPQTAAFLRSMDELAQIVGLDRLQPGPAETLHVAFLRRPPAPAQVEALLQLNSPADEFAVIGREAYNLRHDRERSVFSNALIEKFCGPATTRNLTTLRKILEKYC